MNDYTDKFSRRTQKSSGKNTGTASATRLSARRNRLALAVGMTLLSPLAFQSAYAGPGQVCLENAPATLTSPAVTNAVGSCTSGPIGTYYANSPKLRKFVDTLPGLTPGNLNTFGANKPGEYIPIAVADTTTYPGSEYFVIGVVEHQQWMHSDLQKATTQRSYVQLYPKLSERPAALGTTNPPTKARDGLTGQTLPPPVALFYPDGTAITWPGTKTTANPAGEQVYGYDNPHYLGPIILTMTGTPVRTQMVNFLPTGRATLDTSGKVLARNGDMFLPVDETLAGAGLTPDAKTTGVAKYPQNRVAFHLHGGDSPWISDGTPHQWVTAVGDSSPYKAGNRFMNVPDMPFPGDGAQTIFWPNDQSSRLMWYHDHTFGLTRQNAYAGAAAGYVIIDAAELALQGGLAGTTASSTVGSTTINKALPNGLLDQIVLVVQDKTFVPDDIAKQDSKWDTKAWGQPGDLWYPHVYEPFQLWGTAEPLAGTTQAAVGSNPAGRWDYAVNDTTTFYQPPTAGATRVDPDYGQVAFPDGTYTGGPSATPESYMDTPVVNGVAYPTMTVEPKAYRVRFLNGANDRYWNLSLWKADATPSFVDAATGKTVPANTEVKIVPPGRKAADGTVNTSNDPAGIPDPTTAGPNIIQFANEAGFLPTPVVHKPTLMRFDATGTEIAGDFYLGGAERADTVIDFSQFAGQTLILYNDGTAPVPGGDPRYDYYTGDADQTPFGGAPSTQPGFGPNTRTVMQIVVAQTVKGAATAPTPADAYEAAGPGGALATELPKAYAAAADTHIVAAMPLPTDIDTTANTIKINGAVVPMQIKTIHGFTDPNLGRLIAQIGTELPGTVGPTPLAYIDAPTDIINAGDTQYWWIKNYDVDNHPMHFHLFNVQVLAHRVQIDGSLRSPEPDEMGWKETVKNWPGEDVIVALKPKTPALPFGLPNSVRLLDPTLPAGATANDVLYGAGTPGTTTTTTTTAGKVTTTVPFAFAQLDLDPASATYGASKAVANTSQDFGWEYVWHCHILGHEENDLMRPMVFRPIITAPTAPTSVTVDASGLVKWIDSTPAGATATKGNSANEIGFQVQRATLTGGVAGAFTKLNAASPVIDSRVNTLANATSFQDAPAPYTDYLYKVASINEGFTGTSSSVKLSQPPAQPTALTALAAATGAKWSVTLGWKDNATNETGYVVQRATGTINNLTGAATWTAYANQPAATSVLAANLASFVNGPTGVAANTLYQYQVYAVNGTLVGPASTAIVVTAANTGAAPGQLQANGAPTASTLGLQWQNTASALATGYEVQQCIGTAAVCKVAAATAWRPSPGSIVLGANTSRYVATKLASKQSYSFRVRSVNTLVPKVGSEPGLTSAWSAPFAMKTL